MRMNVKFSAFLPVVFSVLLSSCSVKDGEYRIDVDAKGVPDGTDVYLSDCFSDYRDTAKVYGGSFFFKGKSDTAALYNMRLFRNGMPFSLDFIPEDGHIRANIYDRFSIRGGRMNSMLEAVYALADSVRSDYLSKLEIARKRAEMEVTDRKDIPGHIGRIMRPVIQSGNVSMVSYYLKNRNSVPGCVALGAGIIDMPVSGIDSLMALSESGLPYRYIRLVSYRNTRYAYENSLPGSMFTDFKAVDMRVSDSISREVRFSDVAGKGKPVLMMAASTWSRPAFEELDVLEKIKADFGDSLEIVVVMLWDREKDVMSVYDRFSEKFRLWMAEDDMPRSYNFKYVPVVFVFDSDGRIVSRDLRQKELVEFMSAFMKH